MVKSRKVRGGALSFYEKWFLGKKDYCDASTVTTETAKANKLIKDGNDTKKKGDDLLDTIKSEQEKCKTSTTQAPQTPQTPQPPQTPQTPQPSKSEMYSQYDDPYPEYPRNQYVNGSNPMYKGGKRSRRYKRHRRKSRRKSHRRHHR